jgi:predicted MFS family arabinose efflux permease
MGIGRFAFTPLLPLMMRDGLIDAAGGAELAAANYLGYLVGALSAARLAQQPLRLVRVCLLAIALLTAGAGLASGEWVWALLRFAAGVASAWAMVGISSWSLTELARRGRGALGALVFTGVGGGITLAGVMAWLAATMSARAQWLQLAAAALVLAAAVLWLLRRAAVAPAGAGSGQAAELTQPAGQPAGHQIRRPAPLPPGSWPLVICYGSFGFGYILPATFLPAMARALLDDPQRFGLVWPVFGVAAMASTLLWLRWSAVWPPLRAWSGCQFAMAVGVALPLLSHSGWAITLAALLVGGTFMLATVIAMQQARALAPLQPAPLLGRMTAAFALGQIAGPLVVRALAGAHWQPPWGGLGVWSAIEITSALATALLLGTALWLRRAKPQRSGPGPG